MPELPPSSPFVPPSPVTPAAEEIIARLLVGDEAAAKEVFARYVVRLTALTRSRMSPRLLVRADAEDVVMSAYRSFFVRAREGAFTIHHENELWRLLVEITLHKLYRLHARHTAERRTTSREEATADGVPIAAASHSPAPEAMVILSDELQFAMREMPPECHAALQLRLEGYEIEQIANQLNKSERTIRRWLDQVKVVLRQRFPDAAPPPAAVSVKQRRLTRPLPLQLESFTEQVLLFENYTLKRQIGEGTTGKVFRAIVANDHSIVAIKFLKRAWLHREEMVLKFLHEVKLLAPFQHPHIIRMHGVGRTPNRGYFLAMDWHARGDLASLSAREPIALTDALRWIREAGEAMAFVHEQGVLHCDLKPSNLLLADDGRIVVTDFGLARAMLAEETPDFIAGTPAFLAPEQFKPQWGQMGPATDVYGLGAILYQLLVGQPPRVGSIEDVLESVAVGRTISIPATVPAPIREVLARCLVPSPRDRFRSVSEFLNALPSA